MERPTPKRSTPDGLMGTSQPTDFYFWKTTVAWSNKPRVDAHGGSSTLKSSHGFSKPRSHVSATIPPNGSQYSSLHTELQLDSCSIIHRATTIHRCFLDNRNVESHLPEGTGAQFIKETCSLVSWSYPTSINGLWQKMDTPNTFCYNTSGAS